MLILSRKLDEKIMIGDDIEITIIEIRKDVVKLGIAAPRAVPVHRQEVYEEIQEENLKAAKIEKEGVEVLPESLTKFQNKK